MNPVTGYAVAGEESPLAANVPVITEASERLVRFAYENGISHCRLLLDPTLRDGRQFLRECLATLEGDSLQTVSVRIAPGTIDKSSWPLLAEVDITTLAGSEVVAASMVMAAQDWQIPSLRAGNGHRMGGWIFGGGRLADLAAHLASCFVQRHAGVRTLIRLYDPSVLDQAWDICTTAQQDALLGPIRGWFALQRDGSLVVRQRSRDGIGSGAVSFPAFEPKQWKRLDHIGPINRAWVRMPFKPERAAVRQAAEALLRADDYGFCDPDDLMEFAWRAFTVSPRFDEHVKIQQCIRSRSPGDSFGYATADVTDAEWSVIAMEKNKELGR